jgi:hypothetical protein
MVGAEVVNEVTQIAHWLLQFLPAFVSVLCVKAIILE